MAFIRQRRICLGICEGGGMTNAIMMTASEIGNVIHGDCLDVMRSMESGGLTWYSLPHRITIAELQNQTKQTKGISNMNAQNTV